jgi:two-component system chemotaxis sensor kinase CheA
MDDLFREFLAESAENLARLDREIVELERSSDDPELLKSIFRTIHTIKGTCGFLGLQRLEGVAHAAENVLGLLRDGRLAVDPDVVSDVLAAVDVIRAILDGLEATGAEPAGDDSPLVARLERWTAGSPPDEESFDHLFAAARAAVKPAAPVPEAPPAAAPPPPVPPSPAPVPEPVGSAGARASVADSTLRVGVGILDLLMNLAGELVLARNQLVQLASADEDSVYHAPLQHLNRVTTDLQEAVMRTRMQPIGNAWGKLPRLVRDLCQAGGKQIELEMTGAGTELDRQVLQAIQDPLTHMVRNSADHGIEAPADRRAAGKPERGTIRLHAYHEGGHVVIEIRDDGRGLDVEAIRAKAVERGLVRAEDAAALGDAQVFRCIFEPGFSTAKAVTSVSGRGVGMDVVRSNIEKIGGTVELTSAAGRGTVFRIRIPLTLAILSALVVGTAGQPFAVPQIGVVEVVRVAADEAHRVESVDGMLFYRLRDTLLPLVRLATVLGLPAPAGEYGSVVVCQVGAQRFGLAVDEILDTHEIVVKPVGRMVKGIPCYAGTTILGDGRVVMILDIAGIAAMTGAADEAERAAESSPAALAGGAEEDDRVPLVVFDSGGGTPQAVPLALVSRLEKVPAADVETADGRWLVQYRGALLPLVPASAAVEMAGAEERPVIVFGDGERSVGLAVSAIHDIVDDRLDVEVRSATPGILGTAVIAGRSTEVLDVDHFLRAADPEWYGARAGDGRRGRVLLVDDSPFFLGLLAPVLRSARYEVVTAGDGAEALARLERGERVDVIVSDVDMPRVDGFELARRLRGHPRWGAIPLLALTGRRGDEDRAQGMGAGFRDWLPKFDRDAVLAAVREAAAAHPLEVSA